MNYCHSRITVGLEPHFAAIVFSSINIPGDERSRTHPGHGYPASTEEVCQYIKFKDRGEMEQWVQKQEATKYSGTNYTIIEAFPKTIITTHKVV